MSVSPAASYDAYCKTILTKKTIRMHVLLSLFSLLLSISITTTLSLLRLRFSAWAVWSPWVWIYGLGLYAGVVAPLLVCRKFLLTTSRRTPRNLREILASPSNRVELGTYIATSLVFAFLFLRLMRLPKLGNDLDGKFLLYSKQTGAAVVNERPVLLVFVVGVSAAVYGVMQAVLGRSAVSWPSTEAQSLSVPTTITRHLTKNLPAALRTSLASTTLTLVLYRLALRSLTSSFLLLLFPLPLLARSTDYAQRHTLLSPSFLLKLHFAPLALVLAYEVAGAMFTTYTSRPIRPPRAPLPTNKLLFSGLRSRNEYFRQLAWLELSILARTSEAMKKSIFEDLSPEYALALTPGTVGAGGTVGGVGGSGAGGSRLLGTKSGLWGALAREGLLLLGEDYVTLLRRGAPTLVPAPAQPAPARPTEPLNVKPLPASSALQPLPPPNAAEQLFKSVSSLPLPLPIPALSSLPLPLPAPLASAPAPSTLITQAAQEVVKKTQEVESVRKVEQQFLEARREVTGLLEGVRSLLGVGAAPAAGEPGGAGRLRGVEEVLPRREMDMWIIDSLTHLIASSPTLDKYGLSPRTAPQLLEALTSFESALQSLLQELHSRASLSASRAHEQAQQPLTVLSAPEWAARRLWAWLGWKGVGRDKEQEDVGRVVEVLTCTGEGVRRVLRTYGEELGAFRFPKRVAGRLRVHLPGAGLA